MSETNHPSVGLEQQETERVTRQAAAERLTDIAYALSTGGQFDFTMNGEQLSVPIGDGVRLKRELTLTDGHVALELELSWSTAHASAPSRPSASSGS